MSVASAQSSGAEEKRIAQVFTSATISITTRAAPRTWLLGVRHARSRSCSLVRHSLFSYVSSHRHFLLYLVLRLSELLFSVDAGRLKLRRQALRQPVANASLVISPKSVYCVAQHPPYESPLRISRVSSAYAVRVSRGTGLIPPPELFLAPSKTTATTTTTPKKTFQSLGLTSLARPRGVLVTDTRIAKEPRRWWSINCIGIGADRWRVRP